MTTAIRQAVQALDGNLPLFAVKTQNAQIAERVAQSRLFADLSSLFGLLALALQPTIGPESVNRPASAKPSRTKSLTSTS